MNEKEAKEILASKPHPDLPAIPTIGLKKFGEAFLATGFLEGLEEGRKESEKYRKALEKISKNECSYCLSRHRALVALKGEEKNEG